MRALFIHAHYDDFEFTAAGTFEMWRRELGQAFRGKVLVCTDGAAGHHWRSRAATARLRRQEQERSAALGGYEFELLRLRNGRVPREGCLQPDVALLSALWKAIRDFEPDYLFCPPQPADPLAGVHVDHLVVAEAVRRVAYLINVPHAFSPEYPVRERPPRPRKTPVILTTYDGYMCGANAYDVAVDTEPALALVAEMAWAHQTQIAEWLPWVGRHQMEAPGSLAEWQSALRSRFERRQRELGITARRMVEVFTVTAWGEIPALSQLVADLPRLARSSHLQRLGRRLGTHGLKRASAEGKVGARRGR